jgi:hypothetical protein
MGASSFAARWMESSSLHIAVAPVLASVHLITSAVFWIGAMKGEAPGVLSVAAASNLAAAFFCWRMGPEDPRAQATENTTSHAKLAAAVCSLVSWSCHLLVSRPTQLLMTPGSLLHQLDFHCIAVPPGSLEVGKLQPLYGSDIPESFQQLYQRPDVWPSCRNAVLMLTAGECSSTLTIGTGSSVCACPLYCQCTALSPCFVLHTDLWMADASPSCGDTGTGIPSERHLPLTAA